MSWKRKKWKRQEKPKRRRRGSSKKKGEPEKVKQMKMHEEVTHSRYLEEWWLRLKRTSQTPGACHHRSSCSKWWEEAWTHSSPRLTMTNENKTCWTVWENYLKKPGPRTLKNSTEKTSSKTKSRTLMEQFKKRSSSTPCSTAINSP